MAYFPLAGGGVARLAALPLLAALLAGCTPAGSATYYVDFDHGDDSRAGTSPETAWQRAPGDALAKGRAGAASLAAGDKLIFRAGVHYRGTIDNRWSGTADKPIIFTGLGWGEGMGIIDGSDPVTEARPCASAADCGGAPQWQQLTRIRYPATEAVSVFLFGDGGLYWRSQLPVPADRFYPDDTRQFVQTPTSMAADLKAGTLNNPDLATAAMGGGGDMRLVFWVLGNEIRTTPVTAKSTQALGFSPEGLKLPDQRDGKVALLNSFAGLTEPGTYLTLAPGVLLAWRRDGDHILSTGVGRSGFDINGQSHIRIDGLDFRNFSGAQGESRLGNTAIRNRRRQAVDVQVRGSRLGPAALEHGGGIISVSYTKGFRLLSSRVEDIQFGSGVRTGPDNADLVVSGNVFRRLGRTAVAYFSVDGGEISGNYLTDIRGLHGNAMSTYLANRNILVANNCVVNASRPLTFQGNYTPEIRNDITIRDNILISAPEGQAAINSWNRNSNGVTISGNVLMGHKISMLMNQGDLNLTVRGNAGNRIEWRGPIQPGWTVSDNTESLTRNDVAGGRFNEDACEVVTKSLTVRTTRTPR